jgi:asparagine synthase (glutamine-hydrolysing)
LETYNYFYRESLDDIINKEFFNAINKELPLTIMQNAYNRVDSASTLNRMLMLDWKQTLADNDLRKVNKMCELAGIKVQYPMLDGDLIEFSTKIPSNLKIKGQQLRYFYKYAMRDFLPAEIINKPKQGFGLPFGVWLSNSPKLKEIAYDSLTDFKKRPYLAPNYIDLLIEKHQKEHAAFYGVFVWVIMMLELWLKSRKF